jgi:hypothetical protein
MALSLRIRSSAALSGVSLSAALSITVPGQPLSLSELSAHLVNSYTAGGSNIVAGNRPEFSGIEVYGSAPAPAPVSLSFGVTNSLASLTWQTGLGGIYQVQYKTDLAQPIWTGLENRTVAYGSSLSVTNDVSGAGRGFTASCSYNRSRSHVFP